MATIKELSTRLHRREMAQGVNRRDLGHQTGISQVTLRNILEGRGDYKMSNFLAVAKSLGMEVVLIPADAAKAFSEAMDGEPAIQSGPQARVVELRARLGKRQGAE